LKLFYTVLLTIVFCICAINLKAQKISTERKLGGFTFTSEGKPLNKRALLKLLSKHKNAKVLAYSANSYNNYGKSLIGIGALGIGAQMIEFQLKDSFNRYQQNWTVSYVGIVSVITGIILSNKATHKLFKAIFIYNHENEASTSKRTLKSVCIQPTSNGMGISINF